MRNIASVLKILLVVIVAGVIVTYAYYKTRDFVRGPIVIITSPVNGATVNDSLMEVTGKAERIAYISLDDRPIFTDENGNFREKLLLYPGYNIISIKASDKFNRSIEKTLEIVYKEPVTETKKPEEPTVEPHGNNEGNATTTKINENINKLLN
jgi:hypothetical protein